LELSPPTGVYHSEVGGLLKEGWPLPGWQYPDKGRPFYVLHWPVSAWRLYAKFIDDLP